MKKIRLFLLSLKEIFAVLFIQYFIIIISNLFFDAKDNIYFCSIMLCIFDIIYIIFNKKNLITNFNFKYNYLLYIMLGASISTLYNMIIYGFNLYSSSSNNELIFLDIFISGLVGPIFEEILFRVKFIFKIEKIINNKKITIFITSLIFAILHFNIISGIIAFVIGIINGYIYIKTRDVLKISLVHISLNIMSLLINKYNLTIFVLGILLMIISLLLLKKKIK